MLQVIRIYELPRGYEALRHAADAEGYRFVARLGQRWRRGSYDTDSLATICAAMVDDELAAIGAQTYDEYDPSPLHRRIRHFYVLPLHRRSGIGRALARRLIEDAFALAPRLHLRATHALSVAFWDAMNFQRSSRTDRSHEMVRA